VVWVVFVEEYPWSGFMPGLSSRNESGTASVFSWLEHFLDGLHMQEQSLGLFWKRAETIMLVKSSRLVVDGVNDNRQGGDLPGSR